MHRVIFCWLNSCPVHIHSLPCSLMCPKMVCRLLYQGSSVFCLLGGVGAGWRQRSLEFFLWAASHSARLLQRRGKLPCQVLSYTASQAHSKLEQWLSPLCIHGSNGSPGLLPSRCSALTSLANCKVLSFILFSVAQFHTRIPSDIIDINITTPGT